MAENGNKVLMLKGLLLGLLWRIFGDRIQVVLKHLSYKSGKWSFFQSKVITEEHSDVMREALALWPAQYHAVYYGIGGYTCNIFVGESLHRAGLRVMQGGKYYSARQIWNGVSPFVRITNLADARRGDIVAFDGEHVEIVTRVSPQGICSRGAGREQGYEKYIWLSIDDGLERCEDHKRMFSYEGLRLFRINP